MSEDRPRSGYYQYDSVSRNNRAVDELQSEFKDAIVNFK